jgi:mono/diheme cytochrome c family protein
MESIRRLGLCLVILLAGGAGALSLFSRDSSAMPAQKSAAAQPAQGEVERGRYLVDNVAMCSECHTPRDENGEIDSTRYLQGAPIWITPVHPTPNWGNRAPALAGLEGFTEDQAETILEKGVGPNGLAIQPPMHIYHMNHADAQAIVAYLKSLPSSFPRH